MLKKCTETDAGGSGAFLNLVSKPIFYATDIQTNKHTESHMEVAPPPKNKKYKGRLTEQCLELQSALH